MVRSKVAKSIGATLAVFIGAALSLPRPYLFDAVNAMSIAFAMAVVFRYWRGLVSFVGVIWFVRPMGPGHLLVASTVLILFAFVGRTAWIEAWRQAGEPSGGLDHVFFAFLAYLAVPACILALAAPRLWRARHSRPEGPTLPMTIAGGILLFAVFVAWRCFEVWW